eukprot:TRINITY_DN3910_c0_g1_i1.p1 TRINITY_DN3910_c0_g1~~TRINITY_DN3910_c0_g1_i1.p1  ORF type:complete len:127 (+),score=13.56 TRINITY_DN3910_c0_g1_i1:138-518(+)
MYKKLINYKDYLEKEIREATANLDRQGVGMKGSLVDDQGFPRGDVDVASVRITRNLIARMHTDLEEITKRIEEDMIQLHQLEKSRPPTETGAPSAPSAPVMRAFALVDEVSAGSPAQEAQLAGHAS